MELTNQPRSFTTSAVNSGSLDRVKKVLDDSKHCTEASRIEWELLCRAVKKGKTDIVNHLIIHGVKLTFDGPIDKHCPWRNVLEPAAYQADMEIYKLLLESGAEVNRKSGDETLLHHAVREKNKEITQLFLQYKADANIVNDLGQTALHTAVQAGSLEIVQLLLQSGANINAADINGQTAVTLSVGLNHWEILRGLLPYQPQMDNKVLGKALSFSTMKEVDDKIKQLAACGLSIPVFDRDENNALFNAIRKGCVHDLIELLTNDIMLDVVRSTNGRMTPLHVSVFYKHTNVASLLMNCGASVIAEDGQGLTPFDYTLKVKNGGGLFNLLQDGNEALQDHFIMSAVRHKFAGLVDIMVHLRGGNVFVRFKNGESLLHSACKSNNRRLIEELLENGCDPDENLGDGTLLHHLPRQAVATELLLKYGADINRLDNYGKTPFTKDVPEQNAACKKSCVRHIMMLKAAGIYVCDANLERSREVREGEEAKEFMVMCEKEIAEAKTDGTIFEEPPTMYNILTATVDHVAQIAENKYLVDCLEARAMGRRYREYGEMIRAKLTRGKLRRKFLKKGRTSLKMIFPGLPDYCAEIVMTFLNNEDLNNLSIGMSSK